ncbi:fumarylacetoacetate hydrolase family protein [Nonomuraea sp. NEAU-A123]|uniref:fumarylacetoacetate hydrolase family protein n=1 Tax=Nonomuraea sp. NEAU-A123 TaxID=2839649 RepID=UPI001BE41BC2|nr:fumarylacetoacetate hydrolase family protein [Nonomuraea sp. NEAU-A123]MBT2225725.1 fumarylacetoacetate hydrolase family protein [Nonomuraea sp. NEAU-A123]
MRWSTYRSPLDGREHIAVLRDGLLHGCRSHTRLLDLLRDDSVTLCEAGQNTLADPLERLSVADADLLAPIPVPPSIRDFMAFEDHLKPILRARGAAIDPAWYEIPAFYFTNPAATLGPTDDVPVAPGAVELDYELEVAAVIGRPGRDLTPRSAEAHIAGYVLMCDWSARDLQRRERGVGLGPVKGKDWATSFGPYLVTADELPTRHAEPGPELTMRAEVNGRAYSQGRLGDLYWSFGEMISYASRGTEVRPGDIIGSGTVGTGCIADLAARHSPEEYPWLSAGDRVRLAADELGAIDCVLVPGPPVIPLRLAGDLRKGE